MIPGAAIAILLPILGKVDEPDLGKPQAHRLAACGFARGVSGRDAICAGGRAALSVVRGSHGCDRGLGFLRGRGGVFSERSLLFEDPVLRLSPFRRPAFALACAINVIIGFGLYSATYLTPIFLGRVRGYSSLDIGTTVFISVCSWSSARRSPPG